MMVVLKEKSSFKMEHVKAATTSHTLMIPEENVLLTFVIHQTKYCR
jgi:hypothetical protein